MDPRSCLIIVVLSGAALIPSGHSSAIQSKDSTLLSLLKTALNGTSAIAVPPPVSTTSRYVAPVKYPCTSDDQCALNGDRTCICQGSPIQGICNCYPGFSSCTKHEDCCSGKCITVGLRKQCDGLGGQGDICTLMTNPLAPIMLGCLPDCTCTKYFFGLPSICDYIGYCKCT